MSEPCKCAGMEGYEMDDENIVRTIKCFKCGADVSESSRFCNSCGTSLFAICPFCGKKLDGGSRYCSFCGKELSSAPKPPAEDFVYVDATGTALKGFFICTHQVTQEEYQNVMLKNPSSLNGLKSPVVDVTWYDCLEYCNKRSSIEGLKPCYRINGEDVTFDENSDGYRLPTEGEWVFAAIGGRRSHGYTYSGSNNIDAVAHYDGNSNSIQPVCTKKPNELGIYDMSGNVWEWCWDKYNSSSSDRVIRGGSWYNSDVKCCSVSYRCNCNPYPSRDYSIYGFRLARSVKN